MRVLQDVRTFSAESNTELDEKISDYANKIQMAIKTISLAVQSYGYGGIRFYATVVFESVEEATND